MKLLPFEV